MKPQLKTIRKVDDSLISEALKFGDTRIAYWRNNEKRPLRHVDVQNIIYYLYSTMCYMMPIASSYKLQRSQVYETVERFIKYIHAISFGYIDVEPLKTLNDMFDMQTANKNNKYIMSDELPKWYDIINIIALGTECHELMHDFLITQQTSYTDAKGTETRHKQMPEYIGIYKTLGGEELVKAYFNGVPIDDIVPKH